MVFFEIKRTFEHNSISYTVFVDSFPSAYCSHPLRILFSLIIYQVRCFCSWHAFPLWLLSFWQINIFVYFIRYFYSDSLFSLLFLPQLDKKPKNLHTNESMTPDIWIKFHFEMFAIFTISIDRYGKFLIKIVCTATKKWNKMNRMVVRIDCSPCWLSEWYWHPIHCWSDRKKKMRTLKLIDCIFILLILKMNPSRLWCVCLNGGALRRDARGSFDFAQANRERIHHISNYGTGFWFQINIEMNQQKYSMFKWKLRLPI